MTPTRYLRVWYVRGFQFSRLSFAFSSSADETGFTPCLKSRFFFLAFDSRAGGTDEASWPIIIFIAITTVSHLPIPASYHKPITASHLPFSNQKQLHQLSRIACTHPHFFPLSSPLFFFSLQPFCSAHLGVFILFYPFSQFPGTGFGGMECAAFEDIGISEWVWRLAKHAFGAFGTSGH